MVKKLSNEDFVAKARNVFGDLYDYSKAKYTGTDNNIDIICPIHGVFSTRPHNFLKGHGCPACSNRQRIDTSVFVERATKKHNGRYDYSKAVCKGTESYVTIICPIHGEFKQKAEYHLNGNGCPKCFGTPKSTTKEFINKAKKKYGNKYDYSKVEYNGNKTKVTITCPKHGDWFVTPNNFLRGSECPKCFGTPKYTTEEFVSQARKIHGNKYDYSKVQYDGRRKKVIIICPIHGEYMQSPFSHLKGAGCRKCSGNMPITKESFIERSVSNHTIKYDYSKVDFIHSREKVCIICPVHGEFWQTPHYHVLGGNCPKCVGGYKLNTKDFIDKAKKVHGDKYDYSKVKYKNYTTKVCIICPEHGEFWQTPNSHLYGAGCPTCPQSNMEGELREILIKNNITFEQEKGFSWLKYKKKMFLDFYLPKYNIAIECQGGQHYMPVELFGGEEEFNKTIERDRAKHDLCKNHGIDILYYSKSGVNYIYPVYTKYTDLLGEILKKNDA